MRYDINREAVKISALSSGKTNKCLTGKHILPPDQKELSLHLISFRKSTWETN